MTERTPTLPQPAGIRGLPVYGGQVSDEWDRRLFGQRGVKTWREMSDHPVIGAGLKAWTSLVLSVGHHLTDATESPEAKELTAFVESAIDDMMGSFADTLAAVFSCRAFGFSLFEAVYKVRGGPNDDEYLDSKYDDGRIGWAEWAPRAQETIIEWVLDPKTQRAVAAIQQGEPDFRARRIELSRAMHFTVGGQRKGNPAGVSALRNSFEPYYYFKNIQRIEAIGVERDLAGIPVAWIPAGQLGKDADPALKADWQKLVTDIRRDEQAGIVMPLLYDEKGNKQYDLTFAKGEGQSRVDTTPILGRYERLMLRPMLVDFLTLGDQAVGSYAQSTSRTDLFMQSVQGDLQSIEEVINIQGIRRLFKLNGFDLALAPSFHFGDLQRRDVKLFADAVVALASAGAVDVTEPDVKRTVYEVLGLPLPDETSEEEAEDERGDEEPKNEQTPPEPEPDERTPAKQAETRRFAEADWEDELEITDDDLDAAAQLIADANPDAAGILDAKVIDG